MSIFEKRVAFKPFEYDVEDFKKSIHQSFWIVDEFNFVSDIQDFHVSLSDIEKSAIKNAMLAISQIEVSVKKFWTRLGDRFPKPEFEQIGVVFGESEVRHADAYSHLLEILNLNSDFELLLQNEQIQGRVDYLTKYLRGASDGSNENYTLTLTLFSLFIENISLFSQFAIIKSFNKYRNLLKGIENTISATMKEELIHALFGARLVNLIKDECPEWFNEDFYEKVYRASRKAYDAECGIVDWIFEKGELDFLPKETLKEFIKDRFNESIEMIGGNPVFEVDKNLLSNLQWFKEEIYAESNTDFFHKRPVTYSKKVQAITAEDLF